MARSKNLLRSRTCSDATRENLVLVVAWGFVMDGCRRLGRICGRPTRDEPFSHELVLPRCRFGQDAVRFEQDSWA